MLFYHFLIIRDARTIYLISFLSDNTIINKNQKMKFSNFVSTIAVVCLAFNTDALRIETTLEFSAEEIFMNSKGVSLKELSKEDAHAAC